MTLSNSTSPADHFIGARLEILRGEIMILVNDLPLFEPNETIGGNDHEALNFNFNGVLMPGRNEFTLKTRLAPPEDTGQSPHIRIEFAYWQGGQFGGRIGEHPSAISLSISLDNMGRVVMQQENRGQPMMLAEPAIHLAGPLREDEWNEFSIRIKLGHALPQPAWTSGQILRDNAATRTAIKEQFSRAHIAIKSGRQDYEEFILPQLILQGTAYGLHPRQYADNLIGAMFNPRLGLQLQPYDDTKSQLRLFGHGRLATLVPTPIRLESAVSSGAPFLYFWKDQAGNWQVLH